VRLLHFLPSAFYGGPEKQIFLRAREPWRGARSRTIAEQGSGLAPQRPNAAELLSLEEGIGKMNDLNDRQAERAVGSGHSALPHTRAARAPPAQIASAIGVACKVQAATPSCGVRDPAKTRPVRPPSFADLLKACHSGHTLPRKITKS
jgi:hypothetical protein